MQWFKSSELDKLIQLIDDAKVTPIGKWFWEDFKNNIGTLVLGYIYAVENKAPKNIRKKLRDLIQPKGKPSGLIFKDVVSEVYKENGKNDLITLVNALIDDEVQFEIKDGDVANLLLNDSKLEKARELFDSNHPHANFVSKYMKADEKAKLANSLFNSDNYNDIIQAMQYEKGYSSIRAYAKSEQNSYTRSEQNSYTRATKKIKNKNLRRKYLLEYVYIEDASTFEDLYETIAEHFEDGVLSAKDVVDILTIMTSSSNGNGTPNMLLDAMAKAGKIKELKELIINHTSNYGTDENFLLTYALTQAARVGNTLGAEFLFSIADMIDVKKNVIDLLEIFRYNEAPGFKNRFAKAFPILIQNNPDMVVQSFGGFDDDFKADFLEKFPDMIDQIDPTDLPKDVTDIFMF